MKKLLPLASLLVLFTIGCNSGGDSGDVEAAKKAAAATPKSVDQLPADMPAEARRGAAGGIAQQQAMEKQSQEMNAARKAAGK